MEFSQSEIRAFNATVEEGNFTRAGARLGISQPAITAQIRKLEGRFSQPLFERVSRGVQLTALGKRLYRITRQYSDLDTQLQELVEPDQDQLSRVVRVATASPLVFMPLLAEFNTRYPQVSLRVLTGTTPECLQLLQEREVDIGLFPLSKRSPELSSLPYNEHSVAAIVPADHPLAVLPEVSVTQLMDCRLIFPKNNSFTRKCIDGAFSGQNLKPTVHLFMDSRHDTCEAVVHGLGIGFALQKDIRPDTRYRAVPIRELDQPVVEHLVWLRSRSELAGIRDFVGLALDQQSARVGQPAAAGSSGAEAMLAVQSV